MRTISEKLAGKAAVVQVNTEENPALSARFGVRSVPVMLLLQNDRSVDQLPGARSVEAVLDWFRHRTGLS